MERRKRRWQVAEEMVRTVFKCPACGHIGRGADPHVSVRATILKLDRFGVAAREPALALEKAWSAYRKTAGLDLDGQVRDVRTRATPRVRARRLNGEPKAI